MEQKPVNLEESKKRIGEAGISLEGFMPNFYGNVKLNFCNGKYVDANVSYSIKRIISKGETNDS